MKVQMYYTTHAARQVLRAANRLPLSIRLLIAAQSFSVFLTETRYLPVKHNVGAFEVVAVLLSISALIYFVSQNRPIHTHRVMLPLCLLVIAAGLSYYKLMSAAPESQTFGAFSVALLMVTAIILLVWYNLLLVFDVNLDLFLRAISYAAGIIGVWVLFDSIGSGGSVAAVGPFKNRAQAGIYMHTAFWLVLIRASWPKGNGFERLSAYPILALVLYTISASGRRSVYFALGVGLVGLCIGMFTSGARAGRRIGTFLVASVAVLGLVYFVVSDFWEPAAFFKARVGMVDERLGAFTASAEETEVDFVVEQRQGGIKAFKENPILGIGYGGFWKSKYSEGHEMHSTPMRFVAELGSVGIILYAWFMIEVISSGFRVWRANRGTPYDAASLVLFVALLSLTVSYGYNRQMTDRTFWLLLAFSIAFETWTIRWQTQTGSHRVEPKRTSQTASRLRATSK